MLANSLHAVHSVCHRDPDEPVGRYRRARHTGSKEPRGPYEAGEADEIDTLHGNDTAQHDDPVRFPQMDVGSQD